MSRICIVFLLLMQAIVYSDQTQNRAGIILKSFNDTYAKNIDSHDNPRILINWAFSSLVLDESEESIAKANKILAEYLGNKGGVFTDLGSEGHSLYWELVILSKIVNDEELSSKLTTEADAAIKTVLFDFAKNFDLIKKAKISHGEPIPVFNSDNHDMIHRGLYLMISQVLKNDDAWKSKRYNDGATPQMHFDAWKDNLIGYFRFRARHGINIEVGSVIYAGVYLQPIFIIYDNCEDDELSEMAGKFLDLYFSDVAQESIGGVRGGAKFRVYKTIASYQAKFDKLLYYNHILFGLPAKLPMSKAPTDCFASTFSKYRPNDVIVDLMINTDSKIRYSYLSNRLAQGGHIIEDKEYAPGSKGTPTYYPEVPSNFLRTSYVTPDYILGTFTVDERQNYMLINSQNQWMGVITNAELDSRITIQLTPTADNRTGYRELQSVAVGSTAIIRKQLAAKDSGRIRIYLSPDMSMEEDGWFWGSNGNGRFYYALKAFSPIVEVKYFVASDDATKGKFITFDDPDIMLVVEASDISSHKNIGLFKSAIKKNCAEWLNNNDQFSYKNTKGKTLNMYSYNKLPEIDGEPVNLRPTYSYKSPYIKNGSDKNSVIVTDTKNRKLVLNFD